MSDSGKLNSPASCRRGVIPCCCGSWFPDGGVASYMNLPEEKREELLLHCVWQPLDRVELLEGE